MFPNDDDLKALRQGIEVQRLLIREHGFASNDIIEIGADGMTLNGTRLTHLRCRDLLISDILAEHSQNARGAYLKTKDLIHRIDARKKSFGLEWDYVVPEDVHQAMRRIRKAIKEAGGQRGLLQSIPKVGYRFSTPNVLRIGDAPAALR